MFDIEVSSSSLKESHWYEYLVRFIFGGLITAAVGIVDKHCGPIVSGLFLAFPSIMPAAVTFLAKHEQERHQKEGKARAIVAGQNAAGGESLGTAIGTFGLAAFALVVWFSGAVWSPGLVLAVASAVWFLVAAGLWVVSCFMPK